METVEIPQFQFLDMGSGFCSTRLLMCPWSCRGRFRCKGIVYGGCGRIPHFSFVKTLAQFALGLWTIFSTSSSYLAATRDWMNPLVCQSTAGFGRISQFLRGLSPRCSHIISTSSSYGGLEWRVGPHNTNNNNLVRLRFNRRGAFTPLWGVKSCSLPSKWPSPIPAIPLQVVRTPHLHGAPTAEETSFVKPYYKC